jgi:hypothetical protein
VENNARLLLCADFGYGYPAGFASLLATPCSDPSLPRFDFPAGASATFKTCLDLTPVVKSGLPASIR